MLIIVCIITGVVFQIVAGRFGSNGWRYAERARSGHGSLRQDLASISIQANGRNGAGDPAKATTRKKHCQILSLY